MGDLTSLQSVGVERAAEPPEQQSLCAQRLRRAGVSRMRPSINQPINQSLNRSINQSITHSLTHSLTAADRQVPVQQPRRDGCAGHPPRARVHCRAPRYVHVTPTRCSHVFRRGAVCAAAAVAVRPHVPGGARRVCAPRAGLGSTGLHAVSAHAGRHVGTCRDDESSHSPTTGPRRLCCTRAKRCTRRGDARVHALQLTPAATGTCMRWRLAPVCSASWMAGAGSENDRALPTADSAMSSTACVQVHFASRLRHVLCGRAGCRRARRVLGAAEPGARCAWVHLPPSIHEHDWTALPRRNCPLNPLHQLFY